MTAVFRKFDLRVPYPENWVVEEGLSPHLPDSVSIQSPGGAFWSVSIHDASTDTNELVSVVLNAIRAEYDEVEVEAVRQVLDENDLYGFDLSFYCLDSGDSGSVEDVFCGRSQIPGTLPG